MAIVLVIVIGGGCELGWAPGAEDSDQSLLIPKFASARFVQLVGISQGDVPVHRCVHRSTSSCKGQQELHTKHHDQMEIFNIFAVSCNLGSSGSPS